MSQDDGASAIDARPPFVFQHGLGADAAQPAALVPSDGPFRVATLECPGHGDSPHGWPAGGTPDVAAAEGPQRPVGPRAPSIAAFAGDVAAFACREVEASGADRPWVLGGLSMGAAIALRLTCRAFDGTRDLAPAPASLVLVRSAWTFAAAPPNMAPFVALADALRRHGAAGAAEAFRQSDAYAALHAASPDNAASLLGQCDRPQAIAAPDATADLLEAIARDGPGVDAAALRRVRQPALVIGCADDAVHPLAYARTLADTLPDARFVEVASKSAEPARHVAQTRRAIDAFLRETAARAARHG